VLVVLVKGEEHGIFSKANTVKRSNILSHL